MTKALSFFLLVTLALIAGAGYLLSLGFSSPGDAAAIRLSATVAVVVQLATFTVVLLLASKNAIAAWGAGALLRFATLVVYAVLVVKVLGIPATAALVSLAAFFFLTTLFEPFFLKSINQR